MSIVKVEKISSTEYKSTRKSGNKIVKIWLKVKIYLSLDLKICPSLKILLKFKI